MDILEAKQDPNKILFSIPDFYNFFNLNMNLITLMKKNPEWFFDDVIIDSVYGCFPGCIWNGGRTCSGITSFENMVATISPFLVEGIDIRYTFNNPMITGRHLYDYFSNRILEISEQVASMDKSKGRIGCTVNVKELYDHIKKSFPDIYLVWSTTKGVKKVEGFNELCKDDLAVMYYGMNNTVALDKLEHPENVEVLCCEACIENCPDRARHYEDIGNHAIYAQSDGFKCPYGCELYSFYDLIPNRKHYVSPDDIRSMYLPRGINKFKISGRNDNIVNVIEKYVVYLAKPEYKDNVRAILLMS